MDDLGLGSLAVLAIDGPGAVGLSSSLEQLNLPAVWFTDVGDLVEFRARGAVVLITCGTVDTRTCLGAVNEVYLSVRPALMLVALPDGRADPWFLHMLPANADVLLLPSDIHLLGPAVSRALLRHIGQTLDATAVATADWHPLVRASVRHILRETVISARDTTVRRVRSLKSVAAGVGASRGYLSRVARTESVPLREVADRWLVAQGAVVRAVEGATWERIAWRAGFDSTSGLSDLCKRAEGLRLRDIERRPLGDVLANFREWLTVRAQG